MTKRPAKKPARAYPDLSDLLAAKERQRRYRAGLSFGEKIERMEALRERLAPLKEAREARKAKARPRRKASPG